MHYILVSQNFMEEFELIFFLGWKEVIGFFIQMTRGVGCLHKAKILHRDIKR